MATAIYTGSTAPGAAATGRSAQGHLQYAVNQGVWWVFYLSSTNQLSAQYSSIGTSWNTPTGSPMTLTAAHGSNGLNFGFAYANLASTDVLHLDSQYEDGSNNLTAFHSRYTLGTTWTSTNAEAQISTSHNNGVVLPSGVACALNSAAKPFAASTYWGSTGDAYAVIGTNADSGSSWTAGFGTPAAMYSAESYAVTSNALFSLGSGNMLGIFDSGDSGSNGLDNETCINIIFSKWTSSWSSGATALASTITSMSVEGWGACALSTSDIHLVTLSNNSNAYVHRRYNGTSWSTGNTIASLTYGTSSGIALVSDGTSVWAFAADTSKNIQYTKWTGSSWSAWAVQEATRTNAPKYLTACYSAAQSAIQIAWTELNGSNYEVWTSQLSLSAATFKPWIFGDQNYEMIG